MEGKEILALVGMFVVVGFLAIGAAIANKESRRPTTVEVATPPKVLSVEVKKPFFHIKGIKLSSVELWAVPTGTGITTKDHVFIGGAALAKTEADGTEIWVTGIPKPLSVTEIYARGFSKSGELLPTVSLPQKGATVIYNAVWAEQQGQKQVATLRVGEEKAFGGLSVKFLRVQEDSRCPANVTCIWAGQVIAETRLKTVDREQTVQMNSTVATYSFDGYDVSITAVEPQKIEGSTVIPEYRITYSVVKK